KNRQPDRQARTQLLMHDTPHPPEVTNRVISCPNMDVCSTYYTLLYKNLQMKFYYSFRALASEPDECIPTIAQIISLIPLVAISPTGLMPSKLANLCTCQNGHSARSYAKCLIPISNHDSLLMSVVETEHC